MTALCCPDCGRAVQVRASAKEGRCHDCRPQRRHSEPREPNAKARWDALLAEHGGQQWPS